MKIKFYSDPSHAWGEVPIKLLNDLGIAGKISQYSYIKGSNAYLEEDCDFPLFLNAYKATGKTVDYDEIHTDYDCWVRNCNRFYCLVY
jgi:hypothetical protein